MNGLGGPDLPIAITRGRRKVAEPGGDSTPTRIQEQASILGRAAGIDDAEVGPGSRKVWSGGLGCTTPPARGCVGIRCIELLRQGAAARQQREAADWHGYCDAKPYGRLGTLSAHTDVAQRAALEVASAR